MLAFGEERESYKFIIDSISPYTQSHESLRLLDTGSISSSRIELSTPQVLLLAHPGTSTGQTCEAFAFKLL